MIKDTIFNEIVKFHGHSCPGVAIGYRMAKAAMECLSEARAEDEEIVAIVENNACGVDAIQVLTGCTFGKGNFIFNDYGKHVYTFICRNSKKAIRISIMNHTWQKHNNKEFQILRDKVMNDRATAQEKDLFQQYHKDRVQKILELPEKDLCTVKLLTLDLPAKARIFNSVTCAYCGESVSESRARIMEGKIACIPCIGITDI